MTDLISIPLNGFQLHRTGRKNPAPAPLSDAIKGVDSVYALEVSAGLAMAMRTRASYQCSTKHVLTYADGHSSRDIEQRVSIVYRPQGTLSVMVVTTDGNWVGSAEYCQPAE